jgi:hypothetical protein
MTKPTSDCADATLHFGCKCRFVAYRKIMQNYFVSWDSQDEGMVRPIVEALQRHNQNKTIFWSRDSIRGGNVWDDVVYKQLEAADGIVGVLTNNESGFNNFINF